MSRRGIQKPPGPGGKPRKVEGRGSLRDKLRAKTGTLSTLKQAVQQQKAERAHRDEGLVLLLDASLSMMGPTSMEDHTPRIDAMKQAACALLTASRRSYSGVVAFSELPMELAPIGNRMRSIAAVRGVGVYGSTAMLLGLDAAYDMLKMVAGKYKVRRIILLSDGCATDSEPEQLVEKARQIGLDGIVLDTIAFGHNADRSALEEMASVARGRMAEADTATELVRVFKALEVSKRGLLTSGGSR